VLSISPFNYKYTKIILLFLSKLLDFLIKFFPKAILTAAMEMLAGAGEAAAMSRKPEIMADAAYVILTKENGSYTGNFAVDDDILAAAGIKDFDTYLVDPSE